MTSSNLTALDQLVSPIKVYRLSDREGTTQITFFPQAPGSPQLKRNPRLDYHGSEGSFTFQSEAIALQQSRLGLLVTVILEPDVDAGELALTLMIPPVNLAEEKAQEIETIAVKTRTLGFVVDRSGAQLKYSVLHLQGVAQSILSPSDPANPPENGQQLVTVTYVELLVLESLPLQLEIIADGTVPTTGWTNPRLIPAIYVQAPPDGIYDFEFVATPPEGFAAQVITPISAQYRFPAQGVKGVRVNGKVALLDKALINVEPQGSIEEQHACHDADEG